MAYEDIEVHDPIPPLEAFGLNSEAAFLSQAAVLLSLAPLILPTEEWERESLLEDGELFPLPSLEVRAEFVSMDEISAFLRTRFDATAFDTTGLVESFDGEMVYDVAAQLYEAPTAVAAGGLAVLMLAHPDPLLEAAAAVAVFDLTGRYDIAIPRLVRIARSRIQDLPAHLARTALSRILRVEAPAPTEPFTEMSFDSGTKALVLIHGTTDFLKRVGAGIKPDWWRPGELLHDYFLHGTRPDVYAGANHFRWGGAYSDQGRYDGAWMLRYWLGKEGIGKPDIVAHSHGGNVVFQATRSFGVKMDRLVVLSCPVHWKVYSPQPGSCGSIQSVRVRWDFIIFADRGAQRFPPRSGIPDLVLPRWFKNHGDPCDPGVWQNYNLDQYL